MATVEAKKVYSRRKELIEPSFGIIKEPMGVRRFLMRGWNNVRAEAKMLGIAFNLRTLYSVWRLWSTEKRIKLVTMIQETVKMMMSDSFHLGLNEKKS